MRWLKGNSKRWSLKKRLVAIAIIAVFYLTVFAGGYYYTASRYLERYREAQKAQECCPPSLPVVESERLIAFRETMKGVDWQTFGIEEESWGEALAILGFSSDMEGMAQFLSARLPPFNYWKLKDMVFPITVANLRKKRYLHSDDGLFHLSADGSIGLLFLSDEVTRYETVHYFHMTDKGLAMGALMRLPEEKRKEMSKALNLIPKPEI